MSGMRIENPETDQERLIHDIIFDASLNQRQRRILLIVAEIAYCQEKEEMTDLIEELRGAVEGEPGVVDDVRLEWSDDWDGHPRSEGSKMEEW